jgi:drug/metabolite transporter (DMT)-like permease
MKESTSPSVPPGLAIPFGILAVSTASIFIRLAQQEAPSLVISAYRLVLASLVLTPFAFTRYRSELASLRRSGWALALGSGIFLALHFASWISSLAYTSVASSVVLVSTTPLWVALAAPFVLGERLNRPVLIGLLVALFGGAIVGFSDACDLSITGVACPDLRTFLAGSAFLGDLLALAGALMAAGYLLIGRRLRSGMSLGAYVYLVYGMGGLVLVAILAVSDLPVVGYAPQTYLWLALLALVPQLLGHSTFNWALRYLPAALVSITLLGEPIGSTILAYMILGEAPSALKIFGAILILIGIFVASRKPLEQSRSQPKAASPTADHQPE